MIYSGCATSWLLRRALPSLHNGLQGLDETKRGLYLRKFGLIASAFAVFLFTALVHAQDTDFAVGAGTLFSTKAQTSSQVYAPPGEKAGLYPSFSFDHLFENRFGYKDRVGFAAEVTSEFRRSLYNGVQEYRPILYDFDGVFATHVNKKTVADILAGVGGERVLFYRQVGGCVSPTGCTPLFNTNHLLIQAGFDVRYTVWRHFFIRPEAHYYRIFNNNEFHSGNLLRVAASVGYTFE